MVQDCVPFLLKHFPRPWRPWIVVGGGLLVHVALGTLYTFGNMLPYMVSYQKKYISSSIQETWFTWLLTAQAGVLCLAVALGGWLEHKIGARLTVILGAVIMNGGVFVSFWTVQSSFAALLITYGFLYGIGGGFSYNASIVCVMKWLPNYKGLASGVVLVGYGCGAFIFNPIQTAYINPWDYKPNCTSDGKKYFCQPDLLGKVPSMFFVMGISYAALQIIGSLVLINPPKDNEDDDLLLFEREEIFLHPKEAAMSSTMLILWLTFFCNSQTTYFVTSLYKRFGETFPVLNDDNYLAWVGSASSIFDAAGRPFWGFIADRYSYQVAMSIMTTGVTAFMLTLRASVYGGRAAFIIWVCGIYLCQCGSFVLFPMVTAKCFGQKFVGINHGIVISAVAVSGVLSSFLTEALLDDIGYIGMFFIVAAFSFIGFLLTVFIQLSRYGRGPNFSIEKNDDDTATDETRNDDDLGLWVEK